jgi:hypothetical protein
LDCNLDIYLGPGYLRFFHQKTQLHFGSKDWVWGDFDNEKNIEKGVLWSMVDITVVFLGFMVDISDISMV